MPLTLCRRSGRIAAVALCVAAMSVSLAGRDGADSIPLMGHVVKTGLYLYSGHVNSLVRLSASGVIVVNGQPAENYKALLSQIHRISESPVRLLITTDHHVERTGTNASFRAAGVQILAHENVARNMVNAPAGDAHAEPPTRTYVRELSVTPGGIDVKVMHFGNAHTNGDSEIR